MLELVAVVALAFGPADRPINGELIFLTLPLSAFSVHLGAMDEGTRLNTWDNNGFRDEVAWLRHTLDEAKSYPPLTDVQLFPPQVQLKTARVMNELYQEGLTARLKLDRLHADELETTLAEARTLANIYSLAETAASPVASIARRRCLDSLRRLIGARAYYAGQLPPSLPLHRIPEGP